MLESAIGILVLVAIHVLFVEVFEIKLLIEVVFALHSACIRSGSRRLLEGDEFFLAEDKEVGGPGGFGCVDSSVWIILYKDDVLAVVEQGRIGKFGIVDEVDNKVAVGDFFGGWDVGLRRIACGDELGLFDGVVVGVTIAFVSVLVFADLLPIGLVDGHFAIGNRHGNILIIKSFLKIGERGVEVVVWRVEEGGAASAEIANHSWDNGDQAGHDSDDNGRIPRLFSAAFNTSLIRDEGAEEEFDISPKAR